MTDTGPRGMQTGQHRVQASLRQMCSHAYLPAPCSPTPVPPHCAHGCRTAASPRARTEHPAKLLALGVVPPRCMWAATRAKE